MDKIIFDKDTYNQKFSKPLLVIKNHLNGKLYFLDHELQQDFSSQDYSSLDAYGNGVYGKSDEPLDWIETPLDLLFLITRQQLFELRAIDIDDLINFVQTHDNSLVIKDVPLAKKLLRAKF